MGEAERDRAQAHVLGANVAGANETEGTGFGVEQMWGQGKGGEGKDEGQISDCPGGDPPGAPKAGVWRVRVRVGRTCCLGQEVSAFERSGFAF